MKIYIRTFIKRPPIERLPSIKRPFSEVPNYLSLNVCIWYLYSTATSIKRPRPPFCCRKVIIYCFFTSIKRPAKCLFKWQNGDRKMIMCIKSIAENIADQPWNFALFRSCQDVALSIGKANDMFLSLRQWIFSVSRQNWYPAQMGSRIVFPAKRTSSPQPS